MIVKTLIKLSEYHDSVALMLVARELGKFPGVIDVGVIMATEVNKALLKESGLLTPEAQAATSNDLVIAVSANNGAADSALLEAEKLLKQKRSSDEGAEFRPRTLRGAVKMNPNANVAVISVAGRYATDEAWDALRRGLYVLLFSDNVSLEDEIALKQYARDHGLLLMGPGAGTTILNGVALGFAMAAAPAITQFVGGTPQMAIDVTREMYEITFSEHEGFTIPILNFRGTPLGIDVRKVMETGILPRLNTGIAHKKPGIGMVARVSCAHRRSVSRLRLKR